LLLHKLDKLFCSIFFEGSLINGFPFVLYLKVFGPIRLYDLLSIEPINEISEDGRGYV
jgi:hypothetical protein